MTDSYKKDKIYFTYRGDIAPTLIGRYRGRVEKTGISIVPKVMDAHINDIPILFEEELAFAEDYLRVILDAERKL